MGKVPENIYMPLLEELIRGNALSQKNETTEMFARMFQKMMENSNCLEDNREMINERLYNAFMNDLIDIRALGCSLGK
jgi:RNA-splicing ligase RtcB